MQEERFVVFPALKEKIVVVKGYGASGIYDLNLGLFHRVSHEGGDFLLNELKGRRHIDEFSDDLKEFISMANEMNLIRYHSEQIEFTPTSLESVVSSSRPVRFAWIEVSSICNQKCLHCFLGEDLNKYKFTDFEKIKEYVDSLIDAGAKQIVFSGGEPTLHPKINEILDYAGQTQVNISLLTNGSSIKSKNTLDAMLRNDVVVKIPLLGWRNSHEIMGGVGSSFKKTIETIFYYSRNGVRVQLGTTVTSLNIADIPKIRQFAKFMGLPLEVSPIYNIGFAKNNRRVLFQHPMREFIDACRIDNDELKPRYGLKSKQRATVLQEKTDYDSVDLRNYLTDTHECGQKIIAVLSSGEVTPCLMIRSNEFSLGNAKDKSLKEILNSPTRSEFENKMKLNNVVDCRGCEARYVCKAGGCPATSLAFKGNLHEKNPLYSQCYYVNAETVQNLEDLKNEAGVIEVAQ